MTSAIVPPSIGSPGGGGGGTGGGTVCKIKKIQFNNIVSLFFYFMKLA